MGTFLQQRSGGYWNACVYCLLPIPARRRAKDSQSSTNLQRPNAKSTRPSSDAIMSRQFEQTTRVLMAFGSHIMESLPGNIELPLGV
jgi:hypothetical protein